MREIKFRGKRVDNGEWVDIKGFEGYYQCNSLGEIRSIDRLVNHWQGGKCFKKGKVLTPSLNRKGYAMVGLSVNGIGGLKSVHRIIAGTFIPNPENKSQINHINGIKTDNRAENLEWCSQSENQIHAFSTGLNKGSMLNRTWENHPRSILTIDGAELAANMKKSGMTISEVAKEFNVSYRTMSRYLKKVEVTGNIHDKKEE